jgi:hypothetical protein
MRLTQMDKIEEIEQLFKIILKLQKKFPNRKFTLDGRLVGDLGEIFVEKNYSVKLFDKQEKKHDGISGNRKVQIKTTFKNYLTFPCGKDNIPDYYIGIKLSEDGKYAEIYNGPGQYIYNCLKDNKKSGNGYYKISISKLIELKNKVKENEKIKSK